MRLFLSFLSLAFSLCLSSFVANAQQVGLEACTKEQSLAIGGVDAALGRGFNLPNWDPDYEGMRPDDHLLSYLRNEGFAHIRLPVDGQRLMGLYSDREEIKAYLDALDETITRLQKLDYTLIIDMHPDVVFQTLHQLRPDEGLSRLQEAWDRILPLIKDRDEAGASSTGLYLELLNEPTIEQDQWWPQVGKLVTHITKIAPKARIIVSPANFQRYDTLLATKPLSQKGIIYAIHFYDPFVFTHQGMNWEPGSPIAKLGGMPFPGDIYHPAIREAIHALSKKGEREAISEIRNAYEKPWNAARIEQIMKEVGDWSARYDAPVVISEFGVLNFVVTPESRTRWLRAVRAGAEKNCIGWTHWDFSDGFALVNPDTSMPDFAVLQALFAPVP